MTDKEIEKLAKERAEKLEEKQILSVYNMSWNDGEVSGYKDGFIDGAKWGIVNAIEWHDLRKDSNDLPKEVNKFVVIALHNCITDEIITTVGTYEEFDNLLIGNVIAWCELPQFKDKE